MREIPVPGTTFTMSDEDARSFMSAPRRDSRLEKALFPMPPTTQYAMQGSYGPSKSRNRKRKFKR